MTDTLSESTASLEQLPSDEASACHSCGAIGLTIFHEVSGVPVHSCMLLENRDTARAFPVGDVRLGFCSSCGFIQNSLFDPGFLDYSRDYEETQGFSPHFNRFASGLAQSLIDRHRIRGRHILEVGCGKGEFLALLCELGGNTGTGIDPSFIPERLPPEARGRVTVLRDFYAEQHTNLTGDLICCRHTLEHIQPTSEFLDLLRRSAEGTAESILFIEVPDTLRVLREAAFWDIYYEHCSYFTPGSLARLCRSVGLDVIGLETGFDDQYLLLTARVGGPQAHTKREEETVEEVAQAVLGFATQQHRAMNYWSEKLRALADDGKRVALWGSGSKAVAFLTTLGAQHLVDAVIDINPFRQGKYLPGVGARIDGPDALVALRPDVVVAMNPIYRQEIAGEIARLGLRTNLIAL